MKAARVEFVGNEVAIQYRYEWLTRILIHEQATDSRKVMLDAKGETGKAELTASTKSFTLLMTDDDRIRFASRETGVFIGNLQQGNFQASKARLSSCLKYEILKYWSTLP